jgi:hypothetical protein
MELGNLEPSSVDGGEKNKKIFQILKTFPLYRKYEKKQKYILNKGLLPLL